MLDNTLGQSAGVCWRKLKLNVEENRKLITRKYREWTDKYVEKGQTKYSDKYSPPI